MISIPKKLSKDLLIHPEDGCYDYDNLVKLDPLVITKIPKVNTRIFSGSSDVVNAAYKRIENIADCYLCGIAYDGEKYYFTKATVKRYRDSYQLISLDSLYSINSKFKIEKNILRLKESGDNNMSLVPYTKDVPTMSVADFLENVKNGFDDILPPDVLEHFGLLLVIN